MSSLPYDLDALEAALAKATPGEWKHLGYAGQDGTIQGPRQVVIASLSTAWGKSESTGHQAYADAAAIVALHNAAPALIATARQSVAKDAEIAALRAKVERLEGNQWTADRTDGLFWVLEMSLSGRIEYLVNRHGQTTADIHQAMNWQSERDADIARLGMAHPCCFALVRQHMMVAPRAALGDA